MKFRLLKASEIDCRVAQIEKTWCTLLLYKDARVDQNILDETVGCMNWQKRYVRENANCIVGIWDEEKKQWVEKEDMVSYSPGTRVSIPVVFLGNTLGRSRGSK